VAVVTGSLEWERLPHWLPAAEPVAVPDLQTAQAALLVGEADAVALSWPTLARMAQASQGQLVAFRLPAWPGASADHLAYAFQPGQRGLRDAWNRAQAAVVGSPAHLAVLQRFNLGAADLARAPAFAGSAP
jgi:polar amino acid transport system substrate-binding protein